MILNTSKHFCAVALFATALVSGLTGCNEHVSVRGNTNAQNATYTQSKLEELSEVAGEYSGTVRMNADNVAYEAHLSVWTTTETQPAEVPTETREIPKLKAVVSFSALQKASPDDRGSFTTLLRPMGSYMKIKVSDGSYVKTSGEVKSFGRLKLPYMTPKDPARSYGELTGTLRDGRFAGSWFTNSMGEVGTFEFVKEGLK